MMIKGGRVEAGEGRLLLRIFIALRRTFWASSSKGKAVRAPRSAPIA